MWRAVGAWPGFTPAAHSLVGLDRWLGRLSRGRVVALGMAPSLMLTTIGRRSAQPRSNPLLFVRDGDDLIVIASNWGGEKDPGWAWNLRADPPAGAPAQAGRGGGGGGGGRGGGPQGPAQDAGRYSAQLGKKSGDQVTAFGKVQSFQVLPLPEKNW